LVHIALDRFGAEFDHFFVVAQLAVTQCHLVEHLCFVLPYQTFLVRFDLALLVLSQRLVSQLVALQCFDEFLFTQVLSGPRLERIDGSQKFIELFRVRMDRFFLVA
jgi:hypothetical protein